MKKKNGFISVSVVYSFFLVFLTMLIFLVSNFIDNRTLLNSLKKQAKEDIADTNFTRYLLNHHKDELIYHNESLDGGAKDFSYRYIGSNPNNYICLFGTCNDANLYRIIGIIDNKVKLIKATSVGKLSYDSDTSEENLTNEYESTYIYEYLNTYFSSNETLKNVTLDNISWNIGHIAPMVTDYVAGVVATYDFNNDNTFDGSIALPYISDYIYASDPNTYNKLVQDNINWMTDNDGMWLIKASTFDNNTAFFIDENGSLDSSLVNVSKGVHPVVFLRSNLKYKKGNGSKTDPFIVG